MPRVIHFEIHADDTQRAVNFYQDIFGWQITRFGGPQDYWLVTTGPENEPGINGAILKRMQPINGDSVIAYVCTIDVPALEDTIAKVTSRGGTIALPKMTVPQIGWLAYCKDTEGNIFGILQNDPTAA